MKKTRNRIIPLLLILVLSLNLMPMASAFADAYDHIYVLVKPGAATVERGGTLTFSADGKNSIGTVAPIANNKLTWSVSGNAKPGTYIDASGTLVVASDETADSLTVTAAYSTTVTNPATVVRGTATVTLTGGAAPTPTPTPTITSTASNPASTN